MKPLLLSMQAFGPFPKREIIDFSALGDNPLFLINGPTGAGKTTLLDAISYALFGKTTGAERQGEQMRCHHAQPDVLTEVDFIFAIGSAIYRVKRQPTQDRPKLRGQGFKEERANATIWKINDDEHPDFELAAGQMSLLASRKINEVTQQVEQLIGLKADQFRQVVVLPQGKFRELLTADAAQREDIFAQLFQTHRYLLIEEQLKESARDLRQQMRQHEQSLATLLQETNVESEQQLKQQIDEYAPQLTALQQEKDHLSEATQHKRAELQQAQYRSQQFAQLERLTNEHNQLRQQGPEIDQLQQQLQRAQKAQQVTPILQQYQWLTERCRQTQQLITKLEQEQQTISVTQQHVEEDYQQAMALDSDNNDLLRRLDQLERWLPQLDALQQAQQQLEKTSDNIEQQQLKLNANDSEQQQLQRQLLEQQSDHKQLKQAIEQHVNIDAQRQQLQLQQQQYQRQQQLREQQQVIHTTCEQLNATLLAQQKETQQAEINSQQLEASWYQQQAVSLAAALQPQQPCPVCGSTTHPQPATDSDVELVEHQQLVAARQAFYQQQQQQQKTEQQLSHQRSQHQLISQQLDEADPSVSDDYLKRQQQSIEEQDKQQQSQRQQQQQLDKNIAESESQLQTLRQQREAITHQLHQQERQQSTLKERLTLLRQEIPEPFRSPEHVQQSITQLQQQLQQQQKRQREATLKRQQTLEKIAALKSQLQQAREELEQATAERNNVHSRYQQQLSDLGFADQHQHQQALMNADDYQQQEQRVMNYQQQLTSNESVLRELQQQLQGQQAPDTEQLQQQLHELNKSFELAQHQWLTQRDRQIALDNVLRRVNNSKRQAEELHKRYAVQGTLADVATGQNTQRLSLHRFVLGVLLDDVLNVASERLEKMTHGRYQLLRQEAVSDARTAGGLTILVEDAYTGQQRSTKTLSGGEGFMAALALALGLSDVVQNYAGGIQLDTLFVDEGFGSLDDEALDMAIDTLAELRASGRTIGIISHVRELKDRLQDRIDVIRERNGSRIVMRTK